MERACKSRDIFQCSKVFPPGLGHFQEFPSGMERMLKSRDISTKVFQPGLGHPGIPIWDGGDVEEQGHLPGVPIWPWTRAEIPVWGGVDVQEQGYFCQGVPTWPWTSRNSHLGWKGCSRAGTSSRCSSSRCFHLALDASRSSHLRWRGCSRAGIFLSPGLGHLQKFPSGMEGMLKSRNISAKLFQTPKSAFI